MCNVTIINNLKVLRRKAEPVNVYDNLPAIECKCRPYPDSIAVKETSPFCCVQKVRPLSFLSKLFQIYFAALTLFAEGIQRKRITPP